MPNERIDWTDRSQDVLARFEACREWQSQCTLQERKSKEMAEWQLMDDLATMVESLSHSLAAFVDAGLGRAYLAENEEEMREHAKKQRLGAMRRLTDKTGARLFPDPAE